MEIKQDFNVFLEKKISSGIISFVALNAIIWILASELHIFYRLLLMFVFSIITIPFNYKKLWLNSDEVIYEMPLLKKKYIFSYNNFRSVNFNRFHNSLRNEYMDLEIKYVYNKKKKSITMPIPDEIIAKQLCKYFRSKNIVIKTNDSVLKKIINS